VRVGEYGVRKGEDEGWKNGRGLSPSVCQNAPSQKDDAAGLQRLQRRDRLVTSRGLEAVALVANKQVAPTRKLRPNPPQILVRGDEEGVDPAMDEAGQRAPVARARAQRDGLEPLVPKPFLRLRRPVVDEGGGAGDDGAAAQGAASLKRDDRERDEREGCGLGTGRREREAPPRPPPRSLPHQLTGP